MEGGKELGGVAGFLARLFINNHKNVENVKVREQYGRLGGIIGIIVNVLLFAAKFTVGTLSGSVSVVADAVNNLSDAGSSIISLMSFKMAAKPADNTHPFGHARIEYISTSVVSVIIMFIGFELIKTSVEKIIQPQPIDFSNIALAVLALSIFAKLWLFYFNRKLGKCINSMIMQATAADSMSDVMATSAVFVSAVISRFTSVNPDAYIGIAVAFFIIYSAIQILRETMNRILGQAPSEELIKKIESFILSYDGVIGIHDLVVHDYGPQNTFASVHVEVDANTDGLVSHDLIDNIERDISNKYNLKMVIHMDPVVTDDPFVNELQKMTEEVVSGIDSTLSIHDFRVVKGPTHHNLIFDVTVPFDCKICVKEITEQIKQSINEKDKSLYAVITIDRSFV
ncbi:MAG TPA: cation diffusion facilitator family transporter [Clostridia bacterium]